MNKVQKINNTFIVPKDYAIEYDKLKDYNEANNENYLPPYRNKAHPSIYEGVVVEIHIVDHCNINCNCCNHFSPLAKPWFISLQSFQEQIQLLKDNIPNVKELILLGGEPNLHPQLLELCKIARAIMGDIIIEVLSNGTNIKAISKYKQEFLDLNICFNYTVYKDCTELKKIYDSEIGFIQNTRVLSKQTLVDRQGSLDGFQNFFNCSNHKLPCLTLKEKKLYICPFCAHVEHFCKKANLTIQEQEWIDYLPLEKINGNLDLLQTFCFTPKNYCNYCVQLTAGIPFGKSDKSIEEFTTPIYQLYFKNYPRYEQIINQGKEHIQWCLNEKLNPGRIDYVFQPYHLRTEITRYVKGKIDIIIPYYNESIEQLVLLRDNLLSQSIIDDCVIYLISDGSSMDRSVINIFNRMPHFNCIFLRNEKQQGPGAARNKGLNNSFNDIVLFLDADDLFVSKTALEEIYEQMQQFDLMSFNSYSKDEETNKLNFVIKRDYLIKNNLEYKSFYFGEDKEFYLRLVANVEPEKYYIYHNEKNHFTEYNATKGINITSTFNYYDNIHFSLLSANLIGMFEIFSSNKIVYNKRNLYLLNLNLLHTLFFLICNNNHLKKSDFFHLFIYYFLVMLGYFLPQLKNENAFWLTQKELGIDIQDGNFLNIQKEIYNYVQIHYSNHPKLMNNAKYLLNILEQTMEQSEKYELQ